MANNAQPENLPDAEIPLLSAGGEWREILGASFRAELGDCLRTYIRSRRWFGGKGREIKGVHVGASVAIPADGETAHLLLLTVEYAGAAAEQYQLSVAFASGSAAEALVSATPHLVIARVLSASGSGILYDASASAAFAKSVFDCIANGASIHGDHGDIEGFALPALKRIRRGDTPLEPRMNAAEQSNSAVLFGDQFILKSFRRLEPGVNPDLEIGRFLSERNFPHTAALAGGVEFRANDGSVMSLGVLSEFFPSCTDGWRFTLDAFARFYDRVKPLPVEKAGAPETVGTLLEDAAKPLPEIVIERMGEYLETARMLGDRTASLHWCLASEKADPAFAPEPFDPNYQQSLFQSLREQVMETLSVLRRKLPTLPEDVREFAKQVADLETRILARLDVMNGETITAPRLRVHGDYHLGQVLHTGTDFLIIDFEGEPARPLNERRIKHSPLKDVAGMLRSFDYAAHADHHMESALSAQLETWARFWTHWAGVAFLAAYFARAKDGGFLPAEMRETENLLEACLLEKAAYELCYELNNRPTWLHIPLKGILHLMSR